eukprot:1147233-Pelagomonas_calceolata.AAC.2
MRQYNGEAVQPEMVAEAVEAVLHLSHALATCMPARGPSNRSSSSAHTGVSTASTVGHAGQHGPCSPSSGCHRCVISGKEKDRKAHEVSHTR